MPVSTILKKKPTGGVRSGICGHGKIIAEVEQEQAQPKTKNANRPEQGAVAAYLELPYLKLDVATQNKHPRLVHAVAATASK